MVELIINMEMPELSKGALNRVHKKAGLEALEWFQRERLKHRFTGRLKRELRWAERAPAYNSRKFKMGSGNIPHRYTGDTRRHVLQGGGTRLIASGGSGRRRLRVVLRGLNEGYGRRPRPGYPAMASELRRFTASEVSEISRLYTRAYVRAVHEEMEKARKRVRVG